MLPVRRVCLQSRRSVSVATVSVALGFESFVDTVAESFVDNSVDIVETCKDFDKPFLSLLEPKINYNFVAAVPCVEVTTIFSRDDVPACP